MPPSVRGVAFAQAGPCGRYTAPLAGLDRRAGAGGTVIDVSTMSCLAGWTAGNVIMGAAAAAWVEAYAVAPPPRRRVRTRRYAAAPGVS